MLKKTSATTMFFFLFFVPMQLHAQIPIPAKVGGTLTVNGTQITHEEGAAYTFEITKQDGSSYTPGAESAGLDSSSDWYTVSIPLFHAEQPGGAGTGETAVIHVYQNGQELNILSPSQGQIQVGEEGSRTIIHLEAQSAAAPSLPAADAGPDQTVSSGSQVTLDASGSSPATSGSTLTYAWTQTSGSSVSLSDPNGIRPVFTAPAVSAGQEITLEFQLTVTDTNTASDADTVRIMVKGPSENRPPVADAGEDMTVDAGTGVTLDASASADPDSDEILTFQWQQTGGIPVILSDSTSLRPVFIAPDPGPGGSRLEFRLTVTDAGGLWDAASVNIDVILPYDNRPPQANAGPDQTVSEGQTVILDGSNSTDPDNGEGKGIISYTWRQTEGPGASLSGADTARASFTAPDVPAAGASLLFELTVSDKEGSKATDSVRINIFSDNRPPVADAGTNQTVQTGDEVILDGSASTDPDGDNDIAAYRWQQILGPIVPLSDANAILPVFTAPPTGNGGIALQFELTVTDKGGLKSSARVTVNVISESNSPPSADAGADQNVAEGTSVTLDASVSADPENQNLTFRWRQIGGIPVTLSDAKNAKPSFTAPDVSRGGGILTFELTVTDSGGLMDSDTVMINVVYTEQPPSADAGPDQSVRAGETVYLDGRASADPDGQITSYLWTQAEGTPVGLSNPNLPNPFFTAPASGGTPLIFQLTVVDNEGLSDTDYVTVIIAAGGAGPVAAAGADQTVDEGSSILLDGSGSKAGDGLIPAYRWVQLSGPPAHIAEPHQQKTSAIAPGVQHDTEIILQLQVKDSNGMTDTDEVHIYIRSLGPGPGDDGGSCFIKTLQ